MDTGIVYGISYMFQFTGLVLNTNGLINLLSPYLTGIYPQLLATLLTTVTTAILRPNLYRYNHRANARDLFNHTLSYYVLTFSFILLGYLLFTPTNLL